MASRLVELARSASTRSLPEVAAQDGGCAEQSRGAQHASDGGEQRVTQHLCDAPERGAASAAQGGRSRSVLAVSSISKARMRWANSQLRAGAALLAGNRSRPSRLLSRLKASSTCQRERYASSTSDAGTSAGSEVTSIR